MDFYSADLEHPHYLVRIHALGGLAHLGPDAAEAVPRIKTLTPDAPPAERLIGLWALARIDAAEGLAGGEGVLPDAARASRPSLPEQAARFAFMAALPPTEVLRPEIDRALPALYNAARASRMDEKLLAGWALHQLESGPGRAVAEEALRSAAEMLDPNHGNYTRHLTYIRLAGPAAAGPMADRLARILEVHDFDFDPLDKAARTALTLAAITSSDHPVVEAFRVALEDRLQTSWARSSALDEVLALGPYACSPGIVAALRDIGERRDEDDRQQARQGLELCGADS